MGQRTRNMDYSIVEYTAEHSGYSCGYCKSSDSNFSHGMWAHVLTVGDYQRLIDRGWRRSGKYCYKPILSQTCCPQYTIRCDALKFKLSKSQKTVLKKMNKFLNLNTRKAENVSEPSVEDPTMDDDSAGNFDQANVLSRAISAEKKVSLKEIPDLITPHNDIAEEVIETVETAETSTKEDDEESKSTQSDKSGGKIPKPGLGPDPSKPPCKKAKFLRMKRREEKPSTVPKKKGNEAKSLEDYLNEVMETSSHKLEMKLVKSNPPSPEFESTRAESYLIYKKYQMGIHNDDPFDCDERNYNQFLVSSPLKHVPTVEGPGYGPFHQQYWLDGKLIAVGVIDILPRCISSVYFYYDPDYRFLSLGTYASLREIAFTRELQKDLPDLHYYYMGFYIHSCPKMRYKGQYHPSFLLCPETYSWHDIEKAVPKLDKSKYSRFEEDKQKRDEDVADINMVGVLHKSTAMTYSDYQKRKRCPYQQDDVIQYAGLVGGQCAQRMLLYRD